jgi:8-oxo-dGTP diphosphatase
MSERISDERLELIISNLAQELDESPERIRGCYEEWLRQGHPWKKEGMIGLIVEGRTKLAASEQQCAALWKALGFPDGHEGDLVAAARKLKQDHDSLAETAKDADNELAEAVKQRNALGVRVADLESALAFEKDGQAAELPRLVACAIIIRGNQVLLEKRAPAGVNGLDGAWDIPGGKVEAGESVKAAAEREIKEELGITIKAQGLCPEPLPSVWFYPGKGERHWLLVGVVCSLEDQEPVLSGRLAWFFLDHLPDDILAADRKLVQQSRAALATPAPEKQP